MAEQSGTPVAVVTGVALGIGNGIVRRFVAGGFHVIGIDVNADALERSAAELEGALTPLVGDVSDPAVHDRAAELAAAHGPLRTWVNNAGVSRPQSIHEATPDRVDFVMGINLGGTFWGTAAAVRTMLAAGAGGAVVNIASVQALRGFPQQPAYAASKGAIVSLTQQVAAEYAPQRIRCNAIAPGVIDTPLNQQVLAESPDPDALRAGWDALSPIGRIGTPEDIGETAWFLGTEVSGFITGQTIVVDGGCAVTPPGVAL